MYRAFRSVFLHKQIHHLPLKVYCLWIPTEYLDEIVQFLLGADLEMYRALRSVFLYKRIHHLPSTGVESVNPHWVSRRDSAISDRCDFDLIVVHSYLILCCVKMMMDLVNCMVWIFLLYDGLNQICKLSVYHLMVKEKCRCCFFVVWWTRVLGVKLLGSSKFRCLAVFNGWLLKLIYFFQYWCDFDLIVVHSYLILCCVKMMMGSGELYGLDVYDGLNQMDDYKATEEG
jgi:hypothetical protein